MSQMRKRFAFVVSTGGAVMNAVLESRFLREQVHSVVFDHADPDTRNLRFRNIPYQIFDESTVARFCDRLLEYISREKIDYILSYYTKFYSQTFRDAFQDRIINFHPSLLPAFKGMDGFGDAISYHARFTGNTVEFIDEVMDEGKIIMQTVCPVNLGMPIAVTRHVVFVQQCRALIQTVKWLQQGRVHVGGRCVTIADARFEGNEYSPDLDFMEARNFVPVNNGAVGIAGGS